MDTQLLIAFGCFVIVVAALLLALFWYGRSRSLRAGAAVATERHVREFKRAQALAQSAEAGLLSALQQAARIELECQRLKVINANAAKVLAKYQPISDVEGYVVGLRHQAQTALEAAHAALSAGKIESEQIVAQAKARALAESDSLRLLAQRQIDLAEDRLKIAAQQAEQIIAQAQHRAAEVAGEALEAKKKHETLLAAIEGLRNRFDGYGDRYILPAHLWLDDLAQEHGFDESGKKLKAAREFSHMLVRYQQAATCKYVQVDRRETAIRFVLDAFHGKVDSALAKVRASNFGTLAQEIRDAAALVNANGMAFRDAAVTAQYLNARLEELKWACTVQELRERMREEQRQIREKIREEEQAQKEFARAKREADRDEEAARKAIEKVQALIAKATDEQRARYESEMLLLQQRLSEAESKSQRALSMAQQTKCGHVYIISNVGSFGDLVFKVGMTRRLEPSDRIRELGDASVPFPFDVHALIYSEDAPKLEADLHRAFVSAQVNKVNPRKEFFRIEISMLQQQIESLGINAAWTLHAAAAQYRETLAIEQRIAMDDAARLEWLTKQAQEHQHIIDTDSQEVQETVA